MEQQKKYIYLNNNDPSRELIFKIKIMYGYFFILQNLKDGSIRKKRRRTLLSHDMLRMEL